MSRFQTPEESEAEYQQDRNKLIDAILLEHKSPRQVALDLLEDCRSSDGVLHEESILSAITTLVVQRNTCAGLTLRFKRVLP
jgi:hypothetical protein